MSKEFERQVGRAHDRWWRWRNIDIGPYEDGVIEPQVASRSRRHAVSSTAAPGGIVVTLNLRLAAPASLMTNCPETVLPN